MNQLLARFDSPVGPLTAEVDPGGALVALAFDDRRRLARGALHPTLATLERELEQYFAGRLRAFSVELAPRGTPFQERVWKRLLGIPYGRTWSYGQLARRIGNPKAVRAVGLANGQNPIAIVIPCHRVIGADGKLVGYGGGLERKRTLLELEGALAPEPRSLFETRG